MHIVNCAKIGADVIQVLFHQLKVFKSPSTDIGLKKFLEDYKKGN